MRPSAPRVCSEPGGQKPVLSLSLDLQYCCLFLSSMKSLQKPMLIYCQLDLYGQTGAKCIEKTGPLWTIICEISRKTNTSIKENPFKNVCISFRPQCADLMGSRWLQSSRWWFQEHPLVRKQMKLGRNSSQYYSMGPNNHKQMNTGLDNGLFLFGNKPQSESLLTKFLGSHLSTCLSESCIKDMGK